MAITSTIENAQAMRELAETYRAFGFNLVPLGADKRPVATGVNPGGGMYRFRWDDWQTQAQTAKLWKDIRKQAFWTEVAGIAAVCGAVSGDLICIDFDKTEFGLVDTFVTALAIGFDWTVMTPGGGWHVWLRCPGLALDKGKLDRPAITGNGHIELRHTGHYAALPGSQHPSGGVYQWYNAPPTTPPPSVALSDLLAAYEQVAPKPVIVQASVNGAANGNGYHGGNKWAQAAFDAELGKLQAAQAGTRNAALNNAALALGQIVAGGNLDESAVIDALTSAALAIGLTESETAATIQSGLRKGKQDPRYPNPTNYNATEETYEYGFVVDCPEPLTFTGKATGASVADGDRAATALISELIDADLKAWGYSFSMCQLDDTIEVNGSRIDDNLRSKIRMQARDAGYGGKWGVPLAAVEDEVVVLASSNSYHPVRRYLEALTWDGADHFAKLAPHFLDRHPPITYADGTQIPVIKAWLWRWLLGAVAKVYASGVIRAQNPMLVLSGQQNMGKSTFAAWLCALPELFIESNINPDSVDHLRHLVTKWIWEVGELGATTRRSDREALKAFLTRQEATFRVPYGHHPIIKPALASFIGTVNPMNTGFLDDPTGSRRFITAELASIDHDYVKTVDVNQLWAQVMHTWRTDPHAWRLTPEEQATRDKINGENEVERPYAGIIARLFDTDPLRIDWWMPTHEIVNVVQTFGNARFDETHHHGVLGATLRGLGLERKQKMINGDRQWGYFGITPKPSVLPTSPDLDD